MHVFKPTKFFGNPGWPFIFNATLIELGIGIIFFIVYGGADYITSHHSLRIPVHFAFETAIPRWPAMTLIYVSLFPAFLLAKFIIRDKEGIKALAWTLVLATIVAGIFFLILPAETAYPRTTVRSIWEPLYNLADAANLTYNLVPSLHVTYTCILSAAFKQYAHGWLFKLLWLWPITMVFATVLTHQHHILDVISGIALAAVMHRSVMVSYLVRRPTLLICKLLRLEEQSKVFTNKIMRAW